MEIHHLKIFASVYKNRSFTKASEELHISQPTISEHIKNLENDLQCRLFDRLGRNIIPTQEAEVLYPGALQLLTYIEGLRKEVIFAGEKVGGRLTLGASTIPGTYILPLKVYEFKQKYPKTAFEILIDDSAQITEKVLGHELLCGVVGAKIDPKRLKYHPVAEDELVMVATDKILRKNEIRPNRLLGLPFLIREEGSGTRRQMEKFFLHAGVLPAELYVVATLGSTAAIKEALKAGLGVSIMSRLAVKEELERGQLKEIKLTGLKMRRTFYLVHHKKRTLPKQYQAFYDFLLKA